MPSLRISDSRRFAIAAALLVAVVSLGALLWAQNQPDQGPPAGTQDQNPFQLKVASNLVVVRVVVRDAQGKPVEGLRKEDFRLFDQGKEQSISQFEVETTAAPAPSAVAVQAPGQSPPGQTAPTLPPAMPQKFIALNFDIFNTSNADLMQARDAADRYLAANLHPNERVAVFASGEMLSDFTADLTKVHTALSKLRSIPMAQSRATDCPHLSDLQALEITQSVNTNTEAWQTALAEAGQCWGGPVSANDILILARRIVGDTHVLASSNLQGLEHEVSYLARMPGQRTIILVSSGFLSQTEQHDVDRIIDRALRSQVVISSLDSRGLAVLLREGDATQANLPLTRANADQQTMDSRSEFAARQVLEEVADGTGGEFFHNDNDLTGGFSRLGGSPVSYTLAFAPTNAKPDGKFHEIKVMLAQKEKGITIQARRGYFAPTETTDAKGKAQPQVSSADPEAQTAEQIREAVLSKSDLQQLPVTLDVKLPQGQGGTRELSLSAHLDVKALHLHKEGEHSSDTVTFVFAIFDPKDNLVKQQGTRARINVLDANLADFLKNGVNVEMTFQLKPETYRIRTVVTESEDRQMTAFSKNITIPVTTQAQSETRPALPAARAPQQSDPSAPIATESASESGTYLDYPWQKLKKNVPALDGLKPDSDQTNLAVVLSKVGQFIAESLPKIPNLVSRENIYLLKTNQALSSRFTPGPFIVEASLPDLETRLRRSGNTEFEYLILSHHAADGAATIEEYRTEPKQHRTEPTAQGPATGGSGFANQWLLFSPANQSDFHFRYLGEQEIDHRKTFVVAFAQVPERTKVPAQFVAGASTATFFFQGVMWIDQSTSAIVLLRTDLLAPIPSVRLQRLTTELHFNSVHIHGMETVLWLPREVEVTVAQGDDLILELHRYSDYHLYNARSRIELTP